MKTLLILLLVGIVVYALYSCLDEIRDVLSKNKEERELAASEDSESNKCDKAQEVDGVSITKDSDELGVEDKPISEMKVKEVVDIVMNSLYNVLSKKIVVSTGEHKYKMNAVVTSLVSIIGLSSIVSTNSILEALIVLLIAGVILFISSEKKDQDSEEKENDVLFSVGSEKD